MINAMNTSANTKFQIRGMAGALLATAIIASAVGLAAPGHADGGQPAGTATQLQSLIPTPANTQHTDGPAAIANNGIRMHFMVNGSAMGVLDAYKAELEGKGWTVTVASSGGWGGAGGATFTGTHAGSYGVFSGGGSGGVTDVKACAWPSQPANPNCGGD